MVIPSIGWLLVVTASNYKYAKESPIYRPERVNSQFLGTSETRDTSGLTHWKDWGVKIELIIYGVTPKTSAIPVVFRRSVIIF